jgi:hypothetical protein
MAGRGAGLYEAKNGSWETRLLDPRPTAPQVLRADLREVGAGSRDGRAVVEFEGYEADAGLAFVAERLRVLANVAAEMPT